MPPRSVTNADLYQQIGALSANVERLLDGERDAKDSRARVLERVEAMDSRHARFEERQSRISERLDAMEPVVASLSEARAKASGVILVIAVIGSIVGGVFTAFADHLKTWVFRMFGG